MRRRDRGGRDKDRHTELEVLTRRVKDVEIFKEKEHQILM
jgi:hypothetical protein